MQQKISSARLKPLATSFVSALAAISISSSAFAGIDTTDILPKNVNNTQLRYGVMDGTDKKFDSSGSLITQLDANTMSFDTKQIVSLEADAQLIINALNSAGRQDLGNKLFLGNLKIDAQPEIRYFAPIYARGITPKLTMAVALPIINYKNNIALTESGGNNAREIHQQAGNGLGAQAEAAFTRMEAGVVTGLNGSLRERGYKPLVSREESLIGDLQVVGVYKLYDAKKFSATTTSTVYLPTGKQDDPDDLADLGTYGELALEQGVLGNYFITRDFGLAAKASYKFVAPLHSDVRVPLNSADALPDQSRKETVMRDGGDVSTISGTAILNVGERIQLGSALDLIYKQKDRVSGSHADWDYALLENNTEQTSARARIGFEYFTTTAYTRGHSKIPFKLAYEFANTFAGKNVLNTTVHEFALSLFF